MLKKKKLSIFCKDRFLRSTPKISLKISQLYFSLKESTTKLQYIFPIWLTKSTPNYLIS